jgi:hypothetical protein
MKHTLIPVTLLFFACSTTSYGQQELVPYGDFEGMTPQDPEGNECNPAVFWFPTDPITWTEIGFVSTRAPSFFSADSPCDGTDFGVPDNSFGTQIPVGGTAANRNYVGLQSGPFRRDGIKIKLKHKLRSGYVYTLRFNAVKKTSVNPQVEIRFGNSNDWDFGNCSNCSQSSFTVGTDGGANNDQWQSCAINFSPTDCDIEWLFIRLQITPTESKMLIDNISIEDPCGAPYICADGYGSLDNINTNGLHNGLQALTFYHLENVENFHLTIYDNLGQVVRTIVLPYPPPTYVFDGLNENGVPLPHGGYTYTLIVNNTCQCLEIIEDDFAITGTPPPVILEAYIRLDPIYQAITAYNLDNVTFLQMKILDISDNEIRRIDVINPANEVAWDGKNNFGAFVATNYYICQVYTVDPCGDRFKEVTFFHLGLTSQSPISPDADYTSHPKTIVDCPMFAYDDAPPPCCGFIQDWYISDKHISGVQDYKINHDIVAVQNVTVEASSDIYFQAGNEIVFYPDFVVEASAEFEAVILLCTGRMQNPNGSTEEEVVLQQDTVIGTKGGSKGIFTPNPSSGTFQIELAGIDEGYLELYVTDVYGRIVYSSIVPNQSAEKWNFTLDLNALGAGLYSCSIYQNEEQVLVQKLVVQ